jgi:hypothetical protein
VTHRRFPCPTQAGRASACPLTAPGEVIDRRAQQQACWM